MASSPPDSSRPRLSLDLSLDVSLLLDHVSTITGATKSQIITAALLDVLPGLVDRADGLHKRVQAFNVRRK